MQLLLDRGANIDAKTNSGHTSIFYASHNNHVQVVNLLLNREAKWPTLCDSNNFDDNDKCMIDPISLSCIDPENGSVFINRHDTQGQYCYAVPHNIPNDPIDRGRLFQPMDVTSIVHRLLKYHNVALKMKM